MRCLGLLNPSWHTHIRHHGRVPALAFVDNPCLFALPACAAPFCAWHQEALAATPWEAAQLEDRMAKREDLVGWLATV